MLMTKTDDAKGSPKRSPVQAENSRGLAKAC